MSPAYQTPAALERAIVDRLARRFPKDQIPLRRNEVAYRRLVARMFTVEPDRWVLKGGFALILRLDPSRTSNDIDVTYVADTGEHALAVEALQRAAAHDLGDFFSFEIVNVGAETDDRARRVSLLCRLGAREFTRFRVDLAVPRPDVPSEEIEAPPLSGIDGVDAVPLLRALAWSQQIAEKVCAALERHGDNFSSRARDLADLGMIATQVDDLDGTELIDALRGEEQRRRETTLPDGLPERLALSEDQYDAWRSTFSNATRGAPITLDDALELATALVNPILDGSAAGRRWMRNHRVYR